MKVKIFLTADFANTDGFGKLNVLGIFTQINALSLPVILPQMHIIAQLEFDWSETGHRVIFIRLFDPDGKELITIPNEFDIPTTKYGQPSQVNILAGVQGMMFERLGGHELKLFMGDNHETYITINVTNSPQHPIEG